MFIFMISHMSHEVRFPTMWHVEISSRSSYTCIFEYFGGGITFGKSIGTFKSMSCKIIAKLNTGHMYSTLVNIQHYSTTNQSGYQL